MTGENWKIINDADDIIHSLCLRTTLRQDKT